MAPPLDPKPSGSLPITEPPSPTGSTAKFPIGFWKSIRDYLKREIAIQHADIPILACCLVSGLCDSSAYNAWSCFVSMQTGNTIFLALGASAQPRSKPFAWLKSLTSITLFLLGCFTFASTRSISPKSRGTLATSFLLQSICIIVAAILVQTHIVPQPHNLNDPLLEINLLELLPLGFLAFQSGGQIVTSRILGFNEVPTTVLTSVYCDIASDPHILKRENVKRNRRVAAVACILVGGIAGGWISRSAAGMSVSLWVAAGIKLAIAASWSAWRPNRVVM
ncbi:hypothetical protein LZ554_001138 [Drepanopeziza brunnea f. sp. 'monogermtubi']|nr:hypothetical protein LZ554_001138 [Drepanopeziza brunnea f. sp. 'monogermtubi']